MSSKYDTPVLPSQMIPADYAKWIKSVTKKPSLWSRIKKVFGK